jgi:hypothetical protein
MIAEQIVEEFNAWLSPKVKTLSLGDYADVLLALKEEIEVLHDCVKQDIRDREEIND